MANSLKFPPTFLWGASTSAHQVEGGNHSNWSVWELENAKALAKAAEYKLGHLPIWPEVKDLASSPDNYISGRAIDHYHRYEQDFDLLQTMGLNAFRFSIEWSRLEPEEGVWNAREIEHYRKYIKAMKARGLEPMLTLFHWTVPVWFTRKGGFERSHNIHHFVDFAARVAEEFGADLTYITTINEPDTVIGHGYITAEHPPQQHNVLKGLWVYRNLLLAHRRVYRQLHKQSSRFRVGFVKTYTHVTPGDEKRLSKVMTWLDTLLRDGLVLRYVGLRHLDFIGLNHYATDYYRGHRYIAGQVFDDETEPTHPVNDLGWEMQPENLEPVLNRLKKYKKPIFVMETGVADQNDAYRRQWLEGTIRAIHNAITNGANVQGHLHWSAFDNFEWAYGRWPRFGLVGIDYENDLKRFLRPSARYYAAFVKKMRGRKER